MPRVSRTLSRKLPPRHGSPEWWDSLTRRDFDNGGIRDDIVAMAGERDRLRVERDALVAVIREAADYLSQGVRFPGTNIACGSILHQKLHDAIPQPLCRDCADMAGICPSSGLPCERDRHA